MPRIRHRGIGSRGFLSVGSAAVLLIGSLAVVLGTGFDFGEAKLSDGITWVFNRKDGEVARVNGSSGRVDMRVAVPDAAGRDLEIVQRDNQVLIVDPETGAVSSVDVNGLEVAARTDFGKGEDLDVVLGDAAAFIIDRRSGRVQRVDPTSLARLGEALEVGEDLSDGVADDAGHLWLASAASGEVVRIELAGDGLREAKRRRVAEPRSVLELSRTDGGIVVTDRTAGRQFRLDADLEEMGAVDLELPAVPAGPEGDDLTPPERATPEQTQGPYVPVVVPPAEQRPDDGPGLVVPPTQPGGGGEPRAPRHDPEQWGITDHDPAVALGDRIYLPAPEHGLVIVLDASGRYVDRIDVPGDGRFETILDDGTLWFNDPDAREALRVDADGTASVVEKVNGEVPRTEPEEPEEQPEPPEEEPTEPEGPEQPAPGKPEDPGGQEPTPTSTTRPPATTTTQPVTTTTGPPEASTTTTAPATTTTTTTEPEAEPEPPAAPGNLTAQASSGAIALAWQPAAANGAPVTRHDVAWRPEPGCGREGNARTGAGATGHRIDGLANGCTYAVTVTATNSAGTGPAARVTARPSAARPGAPAAVRAAANAGGNLDGSVQVSWEAADFGGLTPAGYTVTATPGQGQPVSREVAADQAALTFEPGALRLGATYTVQVVARADGGAAGDPATAAETVQPYASPAGVQLSVTRTNAQRWRVTATPNWQGRTGYVEIQGLASGRQQVDAGQSAQWTVDVPWGGGGNVSVLACIDGGASCTPARSERVDNPLPRFTGRLAPVWGECMLNPDAGNGVADNDRVFEHAHWRAPIDFGAAGSAQYVSDAQYQWWYSYTPDGVVDVRSNTFGQNPSGGHIDGNRFVAPSRRHEDAYQYWITARFRVRGHDGWITSAQTIDVSPDCPGDN